MSVTHVFCDEAGFTGNRMLDAQQPYFTYSAVVVDPAEASDFVASVIRDFGIQGGELKSERLVKFNKGRRALAKILDWLEGRYSAVFYHKKYSLACKFFEYIFEPPLQDNNILFYEKNFHRHIANCLYMHFESRMAVAEEIMEEFETFMRQKDLAGLGTLFSTPSGNSDVADAMQAMLDVAVGYREAIVEEIDALAGSDGVGKWVLDATFSSVFSLLADLGQRHDVLEVYCDESKPLAADGPFFDVMVGREDRRHSHLGGKRRAITWNMSKPLQLVNSKMQPAIQLADAVSGSLCFALKNEGDPAARELLERIAPHLHDDCVYPDLSATDLSNGEAFANAIVLLELAARAREGADPLEGMAEFYRAIEFRLAVDPPPFIERS